MADVRLRTWETLFQRALSLIDSIDAAGAPLRNWSFGGGTVLMRRYRHRLSKDIDIFISDPQYLGYLSPRLNTVAEEMVVGYVEQADFLKLHFPEGEIDFVASAALTQGNPTVKEVIFGRPVDVETSTEIVAKKIWHRGDQFRARDVFDFALVAEREPDALFEIRAVLRERREVLLAHIRRADRELREDFVELEVLEYQRTYDECLSILTETLRRA